MKLLLPFLILTLASCGKFNFYKKSSQEKQDVSKIYATGTLKVSVFYEEGAEPYTDLAGTLLGLSGNTNLKVWNVLQENLKAMFPGKTILVPKEISEMSKMSTQNQSSWSYSEMHELGSRLGQPSAGDETVFNVFFVKGNSENGAGVIGVHLSGTKTIVIFKDVVKNSDPSPLIKTYVEQGTLVHEMGHAVGLVNNGIPMISAHEDTAHRAHCNNPKCVMYWMNEGRDAFVNFLKDRQSNPNAVMLDQACLKDVTSYKK